MSQSGSITSSYISGHSSAVTSAHSIRTVANSLSFLIPYLEKIAPASTILDVGCGPGSITLDIARRLPAATVFGVDGSGSVIEQARQAATDSGVANVRFAVGDAEKLQELDVEGFAEALNGGCDLVYAHQVLQHTTNPLKVVQAMRAAAKDHAGLVAFREGDWGMMAIWPESEGIRKFHDMYTSIMRAKGCDPHVGRRLVSLALQAGWKREEIEATEGSWIYSTEDERKWYASSTVQRLSAETPPGKTALEEGFLSGPSELEEIKQAWKAWTECADGWYAIACPQIVCRKGE